MNDDPDLKAAYALHSPEAVRALYKKWAFSYDTGFGESQGYQIPREVALAFVAAGGTGPVLDVGAGTGLVAEQFAPFDVGPIDGVDVSPDMLQVADMKGLYRNLIEADITQPLPGSAPYAGIVSAGTFTLGHVGPEGVIALMDAADNGALFVISVNAQHFKSAGFEDMLAQLGDRIHGLTFKDIRIYDDRADAPHRNDMARLLIFRKT